MKSRTKFSVFLALFLFSTSGCDGSSLPDSAKPGSGAGEGSGEPGSGDAKSEVKRVGSLAGRSFEVKTVGETDVFVSTGDSADQDEALHSGTARVVDGCLFVGDALVVWPSNDGMVSANDALSKAKAGADDLFQLTGGGISTKEGDAKLDVSGLGIKCNAEHVWFASDVSVKPGGQSGSKRVGKLGDRPFEIKSIDDVDVFFSTSTGGNSDEALHGGVPAVVDGCLFVGDALVVWPVTGAEQAQGVLRKAKSGSAESIRLSGGGLNVKEGDAQIDTAALGIKCKVDSVWFAD